MESHSFSPFLNYLRTSFSTIFVFLTISFSLFAAMLYFLRQKLCYCNCQICSNYLSSNWSKNFINLCDWYAHLLENSPSQTIHVHVLGNVITSNPKNVEYILKSNFDNYPKGKPFSLILGDLLGRGIFNVDGDLWHSQRKMASLELATISVRTYAFEIVCSEIKTRLLPLLSMAASNNKDFHRTIDLQDVFRRFSFDNICKFSFGLDPCCLESSLPISRFAESFDLASRLSAERAMTTFPLVWKIKRVLNIGSERKLKNAIKVVNILANEVITVKRKLGFSTHRDLLSRFMACINEEDYLKDIVISFILAGRDTMASALTSLFWLLARHPNVVHKIQDESDRHITEANQEIATYAQIREMHYLHGAVYESLRLYPPVQFDSKFAKDDDFLPDGTFVRKGTRVTYHPYAMGRMETIWGQDWMEFKPERWLRNGTFCPTSPFNFPVFQAGARVCLGKELSLVEMKIVALSVVRKFDLEIVEPEVSPRFGPGLTAMLSRGLPVVIRERHVTPQ